jgi:hypothetical protein
MIAEFLPDRDYSLLPGGYVGRLQTFRALLNLKIYSLSFDQCLEAITGNCREMYEYVFSTICRSDETKALGVIKPFNSTCSHVTYLKNKI